MGNRVDCGDDERVVDAVLEGGPVDLPANLRKLRAVTVDRKIKIEHRGGYEHFERDEGRNTSRETGPVVFRWIARTRIAE
jgi:hypothetical protein